MNLKRSALVGVGAVAAALMPMAVHSTPAHHAAVANGSPTAVDPLAKVPLAFEANRGQVDPKVAFVARSSGYAVFLTPDDTVLDLGHGNALRMRFAGSDPAATIAGIDRLATRANYYRGSDPSGWLTNVDTYARVAYRGVYPGIDVVYHGTGSKLEYDVNVAPEADPTQVKLAFDGAGKLQLNGGELLASVPGGDVRLGRPYAYQDTAVGRRTVESSYVMKGSGIGFRIGAYDASRPLVIDPIVYSTFVGGTSYDWAEGIDVDATGSVYVTGHTQSSNFPTVNAFQGNQSNDDAYVFKLDPSGSTLLYSTYLGGSAPDAGRDVATGAAGDAYVYGNTSSDDFPTTPGAFDTARTFTDGVVTPGSTTFQSASANFVATDFNRLVTAPNLPANTRVEAIVNATTVILTHPASAGGSALTFTLGGGHGESSFVMKLTPAGALTYATYLGRTFGAPAGMAIDGAGQVYVTGGAYPDFPVTAGGYQTEAPNGGAFLSKFDSTGSQLLYSTFLAGSGPRGDQGFGVAADNAGDAYVSGVTGSSDFPTTANAFQPTNPDPAQDHAFLAKIDTTAFGAPSLKYSTHLGGNGSEGHRPVAGAKVAIDDRGHAWLASSTTSTNFPTTSGAFDTVADGSAFGQVFVSKLDTNASGSASLVYSTYLGDAAGDAETTTWSFTTIAVDPNGNAYVTSGTNSPTWPTASPVDGHVRGDMNTVATKLNAAGTGLVWSTYLGGTSGFIEGFVSASALDAAGNLYVAGGGASTDFPSAPGQPAPVLTGGDPTVNDAFVVKLTASPTPRPTDFNANGTNEVAVFRSGTWLSHDTVGADTNVVFGAAGDVAVPADYNGDGFTDTAVYRPSQGAWYVRGQAGAFWGSATDIPVPGDYNGDGKADIAVFRPSQGAWYVRGQAGALFGTSGDIPVPGDYNGDGRTDVAIYRPSNGGWYIQGQAGAQWGSPGDIPVPGDYDGNGTTDIAVYRPLTGGWYIRGQAGAVWGGTPGDLPQPADYDRDGKADIAVFRPANNAWYILGQPGAVLGQSGDVPLPLPDAIRRFFP